MQITLVELLVKEVTILIETMEDVINVMLIVLLAMDQLIKTVFLVNS